MEALIVLVIIIALLLILGVPAEVLMLGLMLLMVLMMLTLFVFFIFCTFRLLRSDRCIGKLSKVENHPKYGYGTPYYNVEGEEYANVFPCEVVMKKQLYAEGRECKLHLDRKRGRVFDGNALVSVIAGIFLSGASFVMLLLLTEYMFGGISITLLR